MPKFDGQLQEKLSTVSTSRSSFLKAAFGVPTDVFKEESSVFRNMGKRFQVLSWRRLFGFVMYMMFPGLAKFLKLKVSDKESMHFFSNIVKKNIEMRQGGAVKRNDFLQLLLEAQAGQLKDDAVEKMDDYERDAVLSSSGKGKESAVILDDTTLIAQCVLFFAAGADTIETVLTYAGELTRILPILDYHHRFLKKKNLFIFPVFFSIPVGFTS